MNSSPVISVIVPCYNQAQYLDECLQSVYDQTFENWECIIVNDGSPDHTEEVARKWVKKDSRFKYFFKENGGVSSARNYGIERAKGEWILPLDGDDYISNNYLEMGSIFFNDDAINIITGRVVKFGVENEEWKLKNFTLQSLAEGNLIHNTSFYRKVDWKNVAGYDIGLQHGYEDWEFYISILKNGGEVQLMEESLFYYRVKSESRSTTLLESTNLEQSLKLIEKKHFDFFAQHLESWHHYHFFSELRKRELDKINNNIFGKVLIRLVNIFAK